MAQNQPSEDQEFQADYQIVRRDVRKVTIFNAIIILLLVALFFVNRKIGLVDKFATRLF